MTIDFVSDNMARRERNRDHGGHHEGDRGGREHEEGDGHLHPQVQREEDPSQHQPHLPGSKSG